MFGNQNADVLSVTDSVLTVRVPHGPIGGGAVDVRVGNAEGQDSLARWIHLHASRQWHCSRVW